MALVNQPLPSNGEAAHLLSERWQRLLLTSLIAALAGFIAAGLAVQLGARSPGPGLIGGPPAALALPGALLQGSCGDGVCDPGKGEDESTCPDDCKPPDPVCGDGVCEPPEDSNNCPGDCKPPDLCGNGSCDLGEETSCPNDCPTIPRCDNGVCDFGENYDNCPSDCPKPPVCGNAVCEVGEDGNNCPTDCPTQGGEVCGNGFCGPNENKDNCPRDCDITISVCGNAVCEAGENYDNCPKDCPKQVCGNAVCEADEATTCPQDCPTIGWCGNLKCEAGENLDNCPRDCAPTPTPTRKPEPTRTPTPVITRIPTSTPLPTSEPPGGSGETTQEPASSQEPPPAGQPDGTDTAAPPGDPGSGSTGDEGTLEPVSELELPPACELVSLEDVSGDVADALAALEDNLIVLGNQVIVCTGQPSEICVPYAGSDEEAQIVDCDAAGECSVRRASLERTPEGELVACVRPALWRRLPRCEGACAASTALEVTPPPLADYAVPGGIFLSVVTVGTVGTVFIFARRKRSLELDLEEEGPEEGLITGQHRQPDEDA